jgi:hypothetical protein
MNSFRVLRQSNHGQIAGRFDFLIARRKVHINEPSHATLKLLKDAFLTEGNEHLPKMF